MKFRSIAIPRPAKGTVIKGESMTVPDQAMSLQTILERFVRGEPMDVKMHGEASQMSNVEDFDNPLNIDYEKLQHADLVEKQEFSDLISSIKTRYESQEKAKAAKADADKKAAELEALKKKIQDDFMAASKGSSGTSAQ